MHRFIKNSLDVLIVMAILLLLFLLLKQPAEAAEFDVGEYLNKTYIKVGTGWKIKETKLTHHKSDGTKYRMNDPLTARIEIGYRYSDNVTFGITHHSQWRTGAPFNDKHEYAKTELFVDYTFELGQLF